MPTFLALITETSKGESTIHDSVQRAAGFREYASSCGAKVKELCWTMGSYDGFVLFEAPDSETACSLLHHLTSQGSVRTQSMQAFNAQEMQAILERA